MKNNSAKALPNRQAGIKFAMGLTGLVVLALIMQLWR